MADDPADSAAVVSLADRGRRHEGHEAFIRFMGVITGSSDPHRCGEMIASGIIAWLVVHEDVPPERICAAIDAAIAAERIRMQVENVVG